jgi:hypothetical protein
MNKIASTFILLLTVSGLILLLIFLQGILVGIS